MARSSRCLAVLLLLAAAACTAPAAPPRPAATPPTDGRSAAVAAASAPATAAQSAAAQATAAQSPVAAASAVQPTPLPQRVVRTAYPAVSLSAMSYFYAEDQGLFARYGITSEGIGMVPQAALAGLLSGEVHYLYYGSTLLLQAARGVPVWPMLQASTGPSLLLFARPEVATLGDLRGKSVSTLGAAGLSREVTELLLEKHGVDPREVQFVPGASAAAQMEQLRQGLATAAPISPPWPIVARREGYRLLANIGQEIAYPFGVMATGARRAADEPAEVKAVTRAILEANRLIRTDRAATIEWIARRFEVDPDVAAESYDVVLETQNDSGEISREGLANYFRIQDDYPELRQVRYEDVVDVRLLQEVWREMGLR